MIAALLPLLALAGQAPADLPPGVTLQERAEAPWLVAALALPSDELPERTDLLAAWLEVPESWPAGQLGELFARGGRLEVRASPEGLLLVAEGAARDRDVILAAALALLAGERPSAAGFPAGQARALTRLAFAQDDERRGQRRALWRSFYGERGRGARLPEDLEIIRATPEVIGQALEGLLVSTHGHALFVEGRLEPGPWPAAISRLRPAARPGERATQWPEPPAAATEPPAGPFTAAWPVPVEGSLGTPVQGAFEFLLQEQLAAAGAPARVTSEAGRDHALVFVEAPAADPAAVREALVAVRALPGALPGATLVHRRVLLASLAAAQAREAAAYAQVGAWARAAAGRRLLSLQEPPQDAQAALGRLVRLMVLPEVLRLAPPAAAARPPASEADPG